MDTEGEFNRRLKELQCQLKRQTAAVQELGHVLDRCAKGVLQRDQAVCLQNLRERVMRKVEDAEIGEVVSSNEFNERKLTKGILTFAVGSMFAAARGGETPLSSGLGLVNSVLSESMPFGTVMVAIGRGGLPEDVEVVSLSRLARESKRSEAETRNGIQERGYVLITPLVFSALLTNLESKILDGSVSLPVSTEQIASELAEVIRRLGSTS